MKTFKWVKILKDVLRHSLVEMTSVDTFILWAVLDEVALDLYIPVVLSKKRDAYMTLEEGMSLEDARLVVEKYLMDKGVIEEGDMMVYEGEEDENQKRDP